MKAVGYIVEFDKMPDEPIDWGMVGYYEDAFDNAIKQGVITEPGRYGIFIEIATKQYKIYRIG